MFESEIKEIEAEISALTRTFSNSLQMLNARLSDLKQKLSTSDVPIKKSKD